jgi:hypothetical protein
MLQYLLSLVGCMHFSMRVLQRFHVINDREGKSSLAVTREPHMARARSDREKLKDEVGKFQAPNFNIYL